MLLHMDILCDSIFLWNFYHNHLLQLPEWQGGANYQTLFLILADEMLLSAGVPISHRWNITYLIVFGKGLIEPKEIKTLLKLKPTTNFTTF